MKGRLGNERERRQVRSTQPCVQTKSSGWLCRGLGEKGLTWLLTQLGLRSVTSEDSGSPELDEGLTVLGQRPQASKVTTVVAENLLRADIGLLEQGVGDNFFSLVV